MDRPPLPSDDDDDWTFFSPGLRSPAAGTNPVSNPLDQVQEDLDDWEIIDNPSRPEPTDPQQTTQSKLTSRIPILSQPPPPSFKIPEDSILMPPPPTPPKCLPKPDLYPCKSCNGYHYIERCVYRITKEDWDEYKAKYMPELSLEPVRASPTPAQDLPFYKDYRPPTAYADDDDEDVYFSYSRLKERRMSLSSREMLKEDQEWERKMNGYGSGIMMKKRGMEKEEAEAFRLRLREPKPGVMWRSGLGEESEDDYPNPL